MPIKVSCRCGQSFSAKDELVGQTLLCPKCHQPITIGAPQQKAQSSSNGIEGLFDEAGLQEIQGPRCPECGAALAQGAVLCVSCGLRLDSGERVQQAKIRTSGERGHTEAADTLLERAANAIHADKVEEKKIRSQGMPTWMVFVAFLLSVGFVATMYLLPRRQAFEYTGLGIVIFAGVIQAVCGIRMLIIVFSESAVCGLLWLFLPFYPLYYLATRWSKIGTLFLMQLAAAVVMGAGYAFIVASAMMSEGSKESRLPLPERAPPALVRHDASRRPMRLSDVHPVAWRTTSGRFHVAERFRVGKEPAHLTPCGSVL